MTRILRIDSSSRPSSPSAGNGGEGSFSRNLADNLIEHLSAKHPESEIVVRDLVTNPVPHIANETISGYYTRPEAMTDALRGATALSDELIAEVKDADVIVLSVPLYNFSIPSALKAWIDHVVRIGHTFSYEDGQFAGLVEDKPIYVCFSYGAGGYGQNGPLQAYDHMKPYLMMVLKFIGLASIETFAIEATTADTATVADARATSMQELAEHFGTIAPV
ncbi:FMN-dependent NADH-azoreductase [Ahrensia sp. R2A130]|uniref:FMN-dependent NADH-azoreductase n=1 Tax=Ahrensia sp. R2A130 TaxID=744979 RepID=UPI0001E0E839|nr:NAD(P)H-dependent oxidoreductase [Ahrensia sp. R2A130]EFL90917.1 fmn-dependent NADH-azoreductase [Ahrensia sp. R2A130]